MPPKPKFTKNEIIDAAFEIARSEGIEAVKAREVGQRLGCSSRPIFTCFLGMDELHSAVYDRAWSVLHEYLRAADDYVPAFKMRGMQLIRFAQREPKLFSLLFMDGRGNCRLEDLIDNRAADFSGDMQAARQTYGLTEPEVRHLFSALWVQAFGICVMCAMNVCTFTDDEIFEKLGECFAGNIILLKRGSSDFVGLKPVKKETAEAKKLENEFNSYKSFVTDERGA